MPKLIVLAAFGLSLLSPFAHASHCKSRAQDACTTDVACRWIAERVAAFGVSPRKAHCRLDTKRAGEIASQIVGK